MADVVILGAGVSGHTAALHLSRLLPRGHTVTVVSPNSQWNWIPTNIWVGVGQDGQEGRRLPARPGLREEGHHLPPGQGRRDPTRGRRGRRPRRGRHRPHRPGAGRRGGADPLRLPRQRHRSAAEVRHDARASGRTAATPCRCAPPTTPCTPRPELRATIERLKAGEPQTLVVGMGHGTCTCEGAAFEYVFNVDHELREAGRARPGPPGLPHQRGPARRLRRRRDDLRRPRVRDHHRAVDLEPVPRARRRGDPRCARAAGRAGRRALRDARRRPPRAGLRLRACCCRPSAGCRWRPSTATGADITAQLFAPSGFMRVDADYTPSPTSSGAAPTGRRPTRRSATRTSSPSASPSRRRTRSRGRARAPTAPSSPPRRRAPGCRRASWARPRP